MYAEELIAFIVGAVTSAVVFSILYGNANYKAQEKLRHRAQRAEDDLSQALRREGALRADARQLRQVTARSAGAGAAMISPTGRVVQRRDPPIHNIPLPPSARDARHAEKMARHAASYSTGPLHVMPLPVVVPEDLQPRPVPAVGTYEAPKAAEAPVYTTGGTSDSGSSFSTGGSDGGSSGGDTGGSI